MKHSHRHRRSHRAYRRILSLIWLSLLAVLAIGVYFFIQECRNTRREQEILPLIQKAANNHGLPVSLVRALVWKESRFNPDAVGSKKEIGLMQITDGAITDWATRHRCAPPSRSDCFDPATNLDIGCWYLALAGSHWDGYASRDILQLAEYNAGRSVVLREWKPETPEETISLEDITFPGTQDYVRQILDKRQSYEHQDEKQLSHSVHHE